MFKSHSLPVYFGSHLTLGTIPTKLKLFPSYFWHCSSLESMDLMGHSQVLHDSYLWANNTL